MRVALILLVVFWGCQNNISENTMLKNAFEKITNHEETLAFFDLYNVPYTPNSIGVSAEPMGPLYAEYSESIYPKEIFRSRLRQELETNFSSEHILDSLLQNLSGQYSKTKETFYFRPSIDLINEENKLFLISFSKPFKGLICAELHYVKNRYKKEYMIAEFLLAYNQKGEIEDVFARTTEVVDL